MGESEENFNSRIGMSWSMEPGSNSASDSQRTMMPASVLRRNLMDRPVCGPKLNTRKVWEGSGDDLTVDEGADRGMSETRVGSYRQGRR